ncbi:LiaI-LiaF-like domain-containing protein [Chloroflexota bacterium]
MAGKKQQEIISVSIWGVFLLFTGIVFLLQTLDILPWRLWKDLWRFWPVLIIVTGLGILLRRLNAWVMSLLVMAIFAACLLMAIWQYDAPLSNELRITDYSQQLGSLESANIDIDFNIGSLNIYDLPSGSDELIEVEFETSSGLDDITMDFDEKDSEGNLYVFVRNCKFWPEDDFSGEIGLTRKVPLNLNISSVASNVDFDLAELDIEELTLEMNAGNCTVTLPEEANDSDIRIEANAANIDITVPEGTVVRINVNTNVGAIDIDEGRFPRQDSYYMSANFDEAEYRVELELECNVGRIQVK